MCLSLGLPRPVRHLRLSRRHQLASLQRRPKAKTKHDDLRGSHEDTLIPTLTTWNINYPVSLLYSIRNALPFPHPLCFSKTQRNDCLQPAIYMPSLVDSEPLFKYHYSHIVTPQLSLHQTTDCCQKGVSMACSCSPGHEKTSSDVHCGPGGFHYAIISMTLISTLISATTSQLFPAVQPWCESKPSDSLAN